jgi:predicted lipoprotein with Yx(FWY)xxD motif
MKRLFSLPARPALIGLLISLSLIVAACSSSTAAETPSSTVPATEGETVQLADNPEFGQILVTADGKTLYTNTVDTPGDLRCTNIACTGFWPPYTVNAQPAAAEGLPGSLGTITRPDGALQVTYNNQPLYTFYQDRQPGDANGNGFIDLGGTWHVVPVEGSAVGGNGGSNSGYGGY